MDVKGKTAIVLGGTSGIGLATTNRLAELGAKVIAVSRDPDKAKGIVTDGVELHSCSVLDRAGLKALFEEWSKFDILVCAATGGARAAGPFLEMDLDAYQGSFAKLWGYTNAVRLAAEHLSEKGAVVLVSGAPARKTKPGGIALGSVGGAVEAFCRAVAPELAPRRINLVSPGIISTPMFGPEGSERSTKLNAATASHLIPRPGAAEEVASGIIFTIQNDFVTGTTVDVDGGWLLS